MLPELPSNDPRAQPSGTKRIGINDLPSPEVADKAIPPTRDRTPLEAAMAAAATYIKMLHKKLQPFLLDLIRQVLKDAPTIHHKREKLQEMRANPDNLPAVCRTFGMKPQAVSEVSKSPGFNSLSAMDAHERPLFIKLCGTVVSRQVFIRSQSLIAR